MYCSINSIFLTATTDDLCSSGESQLISLTQETQHSLTNFIFSLCTLCLGSQAPLTLTGLPLLATPGACEATHILPAAQDGDMALSHFHWKTTASGYHRCQQGARGVALAMMLLAAAAAEVGKACFAYIFCLASWPAGYDTLLQHLAEQNQRKYVYTFRLRCIPPP